MNTQLNRTITPQPPVRTIRLMIVDDSPDQVLVLKRAVQHWLPGVSVISAHTSAQALEYLEAHVHEPWAMPSLILLDLYLPRREDGWYTLDQIKSPTSPFNRIPVIMLSASNNQEDIRHTYRRGCVSYLIKPSNAYSLEAYCMTLKSLW